jgi:hypothetical protein
MNDSLKNLLQPLAFQPRYYRYKSPETFLLPLGRRSLVVGRLE